MSTRHLPALALTIAVGLAPGPLTGDETPSIPDVRLDGKDIVVDFDGAKESLRIPYSSELFPAPAGS